MVRSHMYTVLQDRQQTLMSIEAAGKFSYDELIKTVQCLGC